MEHYEFENLIAFNIKDTLDYVSNSVNIKHILNKKTGNIMAMSLDYGKVYQPTVSSFSTFLHVIEGKAEVVLNNLSSYMQNGDSMIIPSQTVYTIEANQRFKMLFIVLESGCDDLKS
ncbi:cupin [Lacinutrix neustonica]|uniref:Cupin n=1 Tax=Lacinutrix neustonica TaxID=2980107 RepID=A0A9E8MZ00_9FLAO|nr:cupin [Lacinutrix neustonica]WAC03102.1 cupin [Lacinutrix neustonica]